MLTYFRHILLTTWHAGRSVRIETFTGFTYKVFVNGNVYKPGEDRE